MQAQSTKETGTATVPSGGVTVETPRPTATGRIAHPATPLSVWVNALISTSEEQRAHLRESLAASGVSR